MATPTELETAARQQYNAVGDTHFSQAEMFNLIYRAETELASECKVIPQTHVVTTVTSTQSYAFPTGVAGIRRMTYDGKKMHPITMREDDALTLNNSTTTAEGTPQYYYVWGDAVYLRPIPDAANTLKFFSYDEPTPVTANTTLEVPTRYHMGIVDFVVGEMYAKDQNPTMAKYFNDRWEMTKLKAKAFERRRQVTDSFKAVQDEESLPTTILGSV